MKIRFYNSKRLTFTMIFSLIASLMMAYYSLMRKRRVVVNEKFPVVNTFNDDHIQRWMSNDPRLIDHVKKFYLYPPSKRAYNLKEPTRLDWSEKGESQVAAKWLKYRRNGFFIEAGALDGEKFSNTLMFEKYYNFTGLLIEPDPVMFAELVTKHRKAWLVKGCISGQKHPTKMSFATGHELGALVENMSYQRRLVSRFIYLSGAVSVWCFPLETLLAAVGVRAVNYFSLEVEGGELAVLEGIAANRELQIELLEVEYMVFQGLFWNEFASKAKMAALDKLFKKNFPEFAQVDKRFLDLFYKNITFNL